VNAEHTYPPISTPGPLLTWLLATLADSSRSRVKELLRSGRVFVNGHPRTRHDHPLQIGDQVSIRKATSFPAATMEVVHDDGAIIVVNKPCGLLSVATETEKLETAFVRLSAQLQTRPFVVHRIDRDTSGLLLFARSAAVRDQLQANWDTLEKRYLAIVEGTPAKPSGRIDNFLREGKTCECSRTPSPGKVPNERSVSIA
jgi:23S rRNA pseudouridine1911/1915/1917 synthase